MKDDARHGRYFLVPPETLSCWVGEDVSLVSLGAWMRQRKYLIEAERGLPTRQVLVPGIAQRRTYYCIYAHAVDGE